MSKKVVHIINSLVDGGAEAILYRLCKNDDSCEHIVISLVGSGKYNKLLKNSGLELISLELNSISGFFIGVLKLYLKLQKLKPDVVQTWMYHSDLIGGIFSKLAGVKKIFWGVHNTTLSIDKSKKLTLIVAKVNGFLSHFIPTRIIYCAERSKEVHESNGFNNKKGVVIRNGYDFTNFFYSKEDRFKLRNNLQIDDNTFLIGHVGRYNPQKDYETLVKAIHKLDSYNFSFKVVLVGTNLDYNNVEFMRLISLHQLDSKIILLGQRNDIPTIMSAFDVFILTSAFGEAFPNVLNEAMLCETPCITTNIGDSSIIVGDTGWVIESKDVNGIINAIIASHAEFSNDKIAWEERGRMCRERVKVNFGIKKMIRSYNETWNM